MKKSHLDEAMTVLVFELQWTWSGKIGAVAKFMYVRVYVALLV